MNRPDCTPDHLILFRKHFCLNMKQAAALFNVTKPQWWRWETGHTPIPGTMLPRLNAKVKWLNKKLAWAAKHCPQCGKFVEKAVKNNNPNCPYCGKLLKRRRAVRVIEVLPPVFKEKK